MLTNPLDILTQFPVRKSKAQKQAFRNAVQSYVESIGYECMVEAAGFGSENLIIGCGKTADYLLSAGTAPSGILTILEILRILPENRRSRVCAVLHDGTRRGLCSYCRAHGEVKSQLVLHLDAVSAGDRIRMFPTMHLKENRKKLTSLYKACGYFGKKSLLVQENAPLRVALPSPWMVYICSVRDGKKERYSNRLRDNSTQINPTNINILRAALTTYICCDAVQIRKEEFENETV